MVQRIVLTVFLALALTAVTGLAAPAESKNKVSRKPKQSITGKGSPAKIVVPTPPPTVTPKKSAKNLRTNKTPGKTKAQKPSAPKTFNLPEKKAIASARVPIRGQILVLDKKGNSMGVFPAYAIDQYHITVRFSENLPPLMLGALKFRANFFGKRSYFQLKSLDARVNLAILGSKNVIPKVNASYNLNSINPRGFADLDTIWPRLVRLPRPDTNQRLPSSSVTPVEVVRDALNRAQNEIQAELSQGTKSIAALGHTLKSVPEDAMCEKVMGSQGTLSVTDSESWACRSSAMAPLGRNEKLFWTSEAGVYQFKSAPSLAMVNTTVGAKYFDALRVDSAKAKSSGVVCGTYDLSGTMGHASYCTRAFKNSGEYFDTVVVVSNALPDQKVQYNVIRVSGLTVESTKRVTQGFLTSVVPNYREGL